MDRNFQFLFDIPKSQNFIFKSEKIKHHKEINNNQKIISTSKKRIFLKQGDSNIRHNNGYNSSISNQSKGLPNVNNQNIFYGVNNNINVNDLTREEI